MGRRAGRDGGEYNVQNMMIPGCRASKFQYGVPATSMASALRSKPVGCVQGLIKPSDDQQVLDVPTST